MTERVVLAYSGGLDTSVAIGWIAEETGAEVIAVAIDVGQEGEDLEVIRKRAARLRRGRGRTSPTRATSSPTSTAFRRCKADALYMDRYPLVSALSRPVIVKHLVAAARQHGATIVAHGCTGKGNDQVRFEVGIANLAPDLTCIAPVRDYAMTRDKAIEFAERNSPADRQSQEVAVLDRPERVGPRGRDRLPRGHLERPDRGRLRLHAGPGHAARARRGRHHLRPGRRRSRSTASRSRCSQAIQQLNAPRGCPGRRPARHGRGPPRRHQEPRGLRGSWRDRAAHRARGARERHGRARPGPLRARRRRSAGASSSTTGCGSRRSSARSTGSSTTSTRTSPATSG